MTHVKPMSRRPVRAQEGEISVLEQIVLLLFSAFFSDWTNYPAVIQNLQKFYAKTP